MTPCRARMLVAAQRQRWPKLAAPRHPNDTRRVGILPGRATFVDEGAECHYEPVPVFKIGNDSVMAALPLLPKLADLPWHSEGSDRTTVKNDVRLRLVPSPQPKRSSGASQWTPGHLFFHIW